MLAGKWHKRGQWWLQQGLDLLFPPRCSGCQRAGHLICPDCLEQMQPFARPLCQRCGLPDPTTHRGCAACSQYRLRLNGLRSVTFYQGPMRAAIHALKYAGQERLAEPLGLLLAEAFKRYGMYTDIILPLPLHPQRQSERGYNQSSLLARCCAGHLTVPCLENIVIRQHSTRPQVGLTLKERQRNVAGAFTLSSAALTGILAGRHILLIDDVSTSGATLEACALALSKSGVREVWGLVLGRPARTGQEAAKGML